MKRRIAVFLTPVIALFIFGCTQENPVATPVPLGEPLAEQGLAKDFQPWLRGEPVPIPGGVPLPVELVPEGIIHSFFPGPLELGFTQGPMPIEPGVIADFSGVVAMAYLAGTATDADGNVYDMLNDIRVYRGKYIDADGNLSRSTFCFI